MKHRKVMKNRPSDHWSSVKALPTRLMDRLWDAFHNQVVEGHQDEDGFHRRLKPARVKSSWPPVV
jgi:hypothetical protein